MLDWGEGHAADDIITAAPSVPFSPSSYDRILLYGRES